MSVHICEFCGKLLHCDLRNLKEHKGCPFEPCLSIRCLEMMRRFGDRVTLCCDVCYEKIQLIKKGAMRPHELKRVVMCMDDRIRLTAKDLSMECHSVRVDLGKWRKEEFMEQTRMQNRLHEARTRNALRRMPPSSTFWQRR